jgi:hypothetical protein
MLAATKEVRMGFLDKLLGRGKEATQDVGDAARDVGSKGMNAADDVGQKAEDVFGEAKDRATGEDEPAEAPRTEGPPPTP